MPEQTAPDANQGEHAAPRTLRIDCHQAMISRQPAKWQKVLPSAPPTKASQRAPSSANG